MAMTDAWMTWAARPDEAPLPAGLVRRTGATRDFLDEAATWDRGGGVTQVLDGDDRGGDGVDHDGSTSTAVRGPNPAAIEPRESGAGRDAPRRRWRPSSRILGLLAAGGVALGGVFAAPGCQTLGPVVAHAGLAACVELISRLFDAPVDQPPMGYVPCDILPWTIGEQEIKFCLFCDPAKPNEVYVQLDCTGKYYPMRLRRIERVETPDAEERVMIVKMRCDERFLLDVQSTVDPFMTSLTCAMRVPNDRMLPSLEGYGTLDVRVDGAPAPRGGDFSVDAGTLIELDGSFDEVTHYAMTCGVLSLSFKDAESDWTVHAHPAVSAIAIFRNGEFRETRFLFAPTPQGSTGQ